MGRIEDAVKKLQAAGKLPSARPSDNEREDADVRLGKVVASNSAFEAKRIEVDFDQLRRNELLVPHIDERALAEQYRAIKRPLLRNADSHRGAPVPRGNLLMVASALAGEGKTFTCINLCLSIAREQDWSVLLVDGDCSKPQLTRLFSAENEPGLLDLLRDPAAEFDAYVMPTDVDGLSILPAGKVGSDASELLASRRMDQLCENLARNRPHQMVIFDSAPILLTTEALALASHVGQIAFVVKASQTPQQAVVSALEKLDRNKAIGCILNQTYGFKSGLWDPDAYGYGYGYGYGDGAAAG